MLIVCIEFEISELGRIMRSEVLKTKIFTLKGIALKLHSYFKSEKERDKLFYSVSNPFQRTKPLLDLSDRTLKRWISDTDTVVKDCHRKGKAGRPSKVDSFKKDLIGRIICEMIGQNQFVTLRTLKSYLKKNHDLDMKKTTLWHTVRGLGYRFKNTKTSKDVLCESRNLVALRAKYLRKLKELREANYEIITTRVTKNGNRGMGSKREIFHLEREKE